MKAGRCHLFTLCWLKCKVTHFLLEVPPPSQQCVYVAALYRLVHRQPCIFKRPRPHCLDIWPLSDKLRRASHSVHLSFQLLGMLQALLSLRHMPTGTLSRLLSPRAHPAYSVSVYPLLTQRHALDLSFLLCFPNPDFPASAGACSIVTRIVKQE